MQHELLVAVAAGLTSMVGWGTADFFAKKTIDKVGDVTTLFWAQLVGVVPLLILFLANPEVPKINTYDPLFIVLFGIVSALSYIPLYIGFGKGKVSILSPIFASYSVVVVILAAIFLNASISGWQIVAVALVFIGILMISIDPSEVKTLLKRTERKSEGVPQVLSAMIVYSFWLMLFDKFLSDKQWVFVLLVIRSIAVLTLFVYCMATKAELRIRDRALYKYVVGIGLFDVLAFAAVSYGYSHTTYIGVVTVLSATFSLPTIVLAYLFLKERIVPFQVAASAVIIAGVVLISIA